MFRVTILFLILLPVICVAQKPRSFSGYLIYRLGTDTTMAGYYELKANQFAMEVLARPAASVTKLKGTLFANGEIESAEGHAYRAGRDPVILSNYRLYVRGDSTFIEQQQPGRPVTISRFPGRGVISNSLGPTIRFFMPLMAGYAPSKVGDSIITGQLAGGVNRRYIIKRTGKDQLTVGSSTSGMMTLFLDKNGLLKSIDAIGSSWNVTGSVVKKFDLRGLADRFAAEEALTGAVPINQLDSVQRTLDKATVKIAYSRPKVRGRNIFGSVVQYDRFWRTGANAATRFTTDRSLMLGDKELPAGTYSIWTIPSQTGWIMMFNSQANIWGTDYNSQFDVLRVPMQTEQLNDLVEQLTIEIKPVGDGGIVSVLWEKMKASVQFRVK